MPHPIPAIKQGYPGEDDGNNHKNTVFFKPENSFYSVMEKNADEHSEKYTYAYFGLEVRGYCDQRDEKVVIF
jgi:hypothetical protein